MICQARSRTFQINLSSPICQFCFELWLCSADLLTGQALLLGVFGKKQTWEGYTVEKDHPVEGMAEKDSPLGGRVE